MGDADIRECPICLDSLSQVSDGGGEMPAVQLACKHDYHAKCLSIYMAKGPDANLSCPLCRAPVSDYMKANVNAVANRFETIEHDADGNTIVYDVKTHRKVRVELLNGKTFLFNGPLGSERLECMELPTGITFFYEGDTNTERIVRIEFGKNGKKNYYKGKKNAERLVRVEFPNGTRTLYSGMKAQERVVRVEFPNGTVVSYNGAKGNEYVVQMSTPHREWRR